MWSHCFAFLPFTLPPQLLINFCWKLQDNKLTGICSKVLISFFLTYLFHGLPENCLELPRVRGTVRYNCLFTISTFQPWETPGFSNHLTLSQASMRNPEISFGRLLGKMHLLEFLHSRYIKDNMSPLSVLWPLIFLTFTPDKCSLPTFDKHCSLCVWLQKVIITSLGVTWPPKVVTWWQSSILVIWNNALPRWFILLVTLLQKCR